MHSERRLLRELLRALLAERGDTQLLYIPRGEEGQRRMIRALLDVRVPKEDDPLEEMISAFHRSIPSASPSSVPPSSSRTRA